MDKREITLDKVEEKARKLHGDRCGMNECYTAVYWSTL